MKVRCIANTGEGFAEKTLEAMVGFKTTKLPLKLQETYIVYGQAIYGGILQYLIIGSYENLPSWYPAEIFDTVDPFMYYEEYYMYDKDSLIQAIWGFKEFVLIDGYVYSLIEREKWAVEIFLKRKKEIDEFEHD